MQLSHLKVARHPCCLERVSGCQLNWRKVKRSNEIHHDISTKSILPHFYQHFNTCEILFGHKRFIFLHLQIRKLFNQHEYFNRYSYGYYCKSNFVTAFPRKILYYICTIDSMDLNFAVDCIWLILQSECNRLDWTE